MDQLQLTAFIKVPEKVVYAIESVILGKFEHFCFRQSDLPVLIIECRYVAPVLFTANIYLNDFSIPYNIKILHCCTLHHRRKPEAVLCPVVDCEVDVVAFLPSAVGVVA